jgi:hypothetical protein
MWGRNVYHVPATICECRSVAHPTPQEGSWLFYGLQVAPTGRDVHNPCFLVAITLPRISVFLLFTFLSSLGGFPRARDQEISIARSQVRLLAIYCTFLISAIILIGSCSETLAQFGGPHEKTGSGITDQLGLRAGYPTVQQYSKNYCGSRFSPG